MIVSISPARATSAAAVPSAEGGKEPPKLKVGAHYQAELPTCRPKPAAPLSAREQSFIEGCVLEPGHFDPAGGLTPVTFGKVGDG